MEASAAPETPVQTPPQSPFSRLTAKFRNLSKKQKIIIGAILLVVLIGILAFIWSVNKGGTDRDAKIIIAKVGDKTLSKSFENLELQFLPGAPTAEIEKVIKEKLVNDQITLDAAQKEGLISGYPDSPTMSKEEYLKRTGLVEEVKKKITDKGNIIKGKMVMVWFYNNAYIGPKGIEGGKEFAYSKIKPVYDKVKSKEITIEEAGQIIKADKSIAAIDPVWESNALDPFVFYKDGTATFWPEYNELLWKTNPGELTPLYLAGGILRDGKPMEELYIFSQVDEKSSNSSYKDFEDWLEQKRKEYNISYSSASIFKSNFLVFADDGPESNQSSNSNDNNSDNTVRSGDWYGSVKTVTGLPLPGAQVKIFNGCLPASGLIMTTDGNGAYNTIFTGAGTNLSCLCNPQQGRAYYNNVMCEQRDIIMGNGVAAVEVHFRCNLPSSPGPSGTPLQSSVPTPTPSPCSPLPAETRNVACPPNHTGTIVETRTSACPGPNWSAWTVVSNTCTPPPACGDSCTSDSYCFGAPDGCTACVPNNSGTGSVCTRPPVCGSSCVRDSQCIGAAARDGCTACVSGTCRIPPSCGTACTTRADCSGAKDNCSECLEGTCTDYNDNMCKCDGMTADMVYPGNSFKFEAFGKVEGGDIKKAQIADITFRMTQDNKVVAKSNPIVPTVVQNSGTKMRFKASWSTPPPPISKNSTYRVFADVRCKPKRIVASNGELASTQTIQKSEEPKLYPPKGLEWVIKNTAKLFGGKVNPFVSEVLAQLSSPSPSPSGAQTNLQLQTLNFVRMMETDNCKFVMFKFDEALF